MGIAGTSRSQSCQRALRSPLVAAVAGGAGNTTGDEPVQRVALASRPRSRNDLPRTLDPAEDRARRLFFNQVLPSGVGGDAVRAWRCHRLGIGVAAALRSLVLDRVAGYLVLVVLFAAGLPVLLRVLPERHQRYGVVLLFGAALCGLLPLFLMDYLPQRLLRFRLVAELAALSREGRRLFARPARSAAIVSLSIATVGLAILGVMLVASSLGVDLSFGSWVVIVPPVSLIQLIPISLAGWGVRELGFVVVLAGFGIAAEAALATSVLVGLCLIIIGLPGGLLWLTGWDIAPAIPAQSGRVASSVPVDELDQPAGSR